MFHYFGVCTNQRGDALKDWQIEVIAVSTGAVVDIYSDENSTPIAAVSGITNRAKSDESGNYDFFVDSGDYSINFYNEAGAFQSTQRYLPMYGADNATAAAGAASSAGSAATSAAASASAAAASASSAAAAATTAANNVGLALTADLASSATGKGSDLIYFREGMGITASNWPGFAPGLAPNMSFKVLTRNTGAGGVGKAGIYSFMVNGTGNMVPFTTIGGTDCVPLSAVVFSGEDAPHPVCVTNIISRYAGLPPGINWGLEIDMNCETPTSYSAGDPRGGQGIVLNTGSTYSPDTAIVVQRTPGEGTGPGWKQGVYIKGVRDAAFVVEAMSTGSAPGMSPAATGTIAAFVSRVGGDGFNRFTITEAGRMDWGSGSSAQDVYLTRNGTNGLATNGLFNAAQYFIGANNVVGPRRTGWGAPSGTATRTTFDTASVTTAQLAERVKALIDDLTTHGLIGS